MMSKKPSLLHNIHTHLLLISLMVIGIVNFSTTYAMHTADSSSTKKDSSVTLTETSNEPVEKEFDKIRKYESYDPATNSWSRIEDFKTVEILEDTALHRNEHYIYHNFWAYDMKQKKWKRVDIRDYGYKHGTHILTPSAEIIKDVDTDKKEEGTSLWKNLALSFAVGGGGTYFYHKANNLDLMVKKGDSEFLLQASNSSDKIQGKAHSIKWFDKRYTKKVGIKNTGVAHDHKSFDEIPGGDITFQGTGLNIPITLGLNYTFFNKFSIGASGNMEINYLTHLTPKGNASGMGNYNVPHPLFYNFKPLGTIAYKVFQKSKYTVIIDMQLGGVFDYGNSPWQDIKQWVRSGYYGSIGVAHERKLNEYFKFFYRLAVDCKRYKDADDFAPSDASVDLYQPGLHLEIGTTLNFGRDTDTEEENEDKNLSDDSRDKTLKKMGQVINEVGDKLSKAEQVRTKLKNNKNRLKGLFK